MICVVKGQVADVQIRTGPVITVDLTHDEIARLFPSTTTAARAACCEINSGVFARPRPHIRTHSGMRVRPAIYEERGCERVRYIKGMSVHTRRQLRTFAGGEDGSRQDALKALRLEASRAAKVGTSPSAWLVFAGIVSI